MAIIPFHLVLFAILTYTKRDASSDRVVKKKEVAKVSVTDCVTD
jgi:hypothetical protein